MQNVVFDGVKVIDAKADKMKYQTCEGAGNAVAIGDTNPVPPCF